MCRLNFTGTQLGLQEARHSKSCIASRENPGPLLRDLCVIFIKGVSSAGYPALGSIKSWISAGESNQQQYNFGYDNLSKHAPV